jgi:hypothetical protein
MPLQAEVDPETYLPPPLRKGAVGWYPEWGKVGGRVAAVWLAGWGRGVCGCMQVCPNCTELPACFCLPDSYYMAGCRCGRSTASAATPTRGRDLDTGYCLRA